MQWISGTATSLAIRDWSLFKIVVKEGRFVGLPCQHYTYLMPAYLGLFLYAYQFHEIKVVFRSNC